MLPPLLLWRDVHARRPRLGRLWRWSGRCARAGRHRWRRRVARCRWRERCEWPRSYRESDGVFTDNGDCSYRYIYATNIASVITPVPRLAVPYDRTLTHRVSAMIGGPSGPTADAQLDFVPDGTPVALTRDIVQTVICQECHGLEFHGHGGDRISTENCATCHLPGSWDPHGGELLDLKVMIHRIHSGRDLASEYAIWVWRRKTRLVRRLPGRHHELYQMPHRGRRGSQQLERGALPMVTTTGRRRSAK